MQWHNAEYDILHTSVCPHLPLLIREVAGIQLLVYHTGVLQQNSPNPTAFEKKFRKTDRVPVFTKDIITQQYSLN